MPDIKVDPGPGYRLLVRGEKVFADTEWLLSDGSWCFEVNLVDRSKLALPVFARTKLPEPPAPKSLSLDEILDEVEAKPSSAIEFFGHNTTIQAISDAEAAWHSKLLEELADRPKHDGHYRTLEAKGTEPIEHMEAIVCRGIPEDLHRIAKRNLNMAMASKHQDRAGEKSGEAWEKELQKAENYLHRAWSGRWI